MRVARPAVRYCIPVQQTDRVLKVLVYSDDATVRSTIRTAIGRKPAPGVADVDILEVATEPAVISAADNGGFDLFILDGEAVPAGGLGVCRQLKDEIFNCPPILVVVGRVQDQWLATWSGADAIVAHPLDPRAVVKAALGLLQADAAH